MSRALIALTIVAAAAGVASGAGEISWLADLSGALDTAHGGARPVLVDVWAIWCEPCKEMDRTTYVDPDVVRSVNDRFVPVKIDADVHGDFLDQRYEVDAYPTVLFLDHEGRELSRIEGKAGSQALLDRLELVLAGYDRYLQAMVALNEADNLRQAGDYLLAVENPLGAAELLRRGLKTLGDAPAEVRHRLELRLGEARMIGGEYRSAAKVFEKLHADGVDPDVQARALMRLAQLHRNRGKDADADRVLAVLHEQFPQQAANLPGNDDGS